MLVSTNASHDRIPRGIRDPIENVSKRKLFDKQLKEFHEELTVLPDGRPVIKNSSQSTKIRPVFDASAREKGKPSLNQCLFTGPNLIELLPDVLDRFRMFMIGLSADIEKAFLQIGIAPDDRDYLCFFYPSNEREIHRQSRVVFGVTSSPFILSASIEHLLDRAPHDFADVVQKLRPSFYVDNCLISVNNVIEEKHFIETAQKVMSRTCFNLRGWESNFPCEYMCKSSGVTRVLGMLWELDNDSLMCSINFKTLTCETRVIKRLILSLVQQMFDPIDASKKAYAACIFVRPVYLDGVKVTLVWAKSRVAPLKTLSILCLELMACCIGARLANSVHNALDLTDMKITF
ncbi:uncharacterized protein TNIN_162381 [Trichonephila inaurata madagascariensis]|uniref:Reverse transcriptase domain-containing protein n=1 Tax=Trichonephila inaurata madagascariensis TaxID=2747483 RepID=A0A8X6YWR2_9ARAC|nr:uncharacterized protein TNIN_162381 [Trichonephila inaurata madagascariensis]